jgi:methionine-rich copper-binding protein CopC
MAGLSVEFLEVRALLNASPSLAPMLTVEPNETVDLAQDLGTLTQPVSALGSIGNGPAGAADVTWYHFHLDDASRVDLEVSTPAGSPAFASVLSLFNSDPQDYGDLYDLDGYRLLAQVTANPSAGIADVTQDLGPGDYFVAISGAGNLDFSPVIAGSGFDGATGNYELTIDATDLGLDDDGPTVLSSDPADGSVLDSSPLAIRLEMSDALDPNTIVPGQTVQLLENPDGQLGDGSGTPIALASVNFSAAADELQLFPLAPLGPGNYVVQLSGNSSTDPAVLSDPNGVPLGESAQQPAGADEFITFQVAGIDGVAGATTSDDTAATARDLGNVTGAGIVQVSGAIGVDPYFNLANPGPQSNPANQVDLYQFQIAGPGRYAMLAEVFAGRIGSPLNPGLSLWELDPSDGQLVFVAGNVGTLNPTQGTDGSIPLFTDPAWMAGLTAGNYYLAVADSSNTPSAVASQPPGTPGFLDPNQTHSAQFGGSTGSYVLNLLVQPAPNPPRVVASSPVIGQVLDQAPTQLTVQFSEPVNLQQLAFQAYATEDPYTLPEVFVEGSGGTRYYPRFLSFDYATNTATFQMLDGLPNGSYTWYLSGPVGLTDFGGNPLVANDASGDYGIPFSVQGPDRGISGNMTDGYTIASQVGQTNPQTIGVLFPDELQAGVTITRGPEPAASPAADSPQDEYVIQVLQHQSYSFALNGNDLPAGIQVSLETATGQIIDLSPSFNQLLFLAPLDAGTYTVIVGGWSPTQSASLSYQLTLQLFGGQDNAPPLVDGPAPALQIQLEGIAGGAGSTLSIGSGWMGPFSGAAGGSSSSLGGSGEGGSLADALTGSSALTLAQVQSATTLTGLGMGPLGGVNGGEASPVPAATVQVALVPPLPTSPVFSRLTLNLVTLTQVISLPRDGEGIEPTQPLDNVTMQTLDQPLTPAVQRSTTGEDEPESAGDLLAAETSPSNADRPSPGRELPVDLAQAAVTDDSLAAGEAFAPGTELATMAIAAVDRDKNSLGAGTCVARLVITGAVFTAAFRARAAVRGLEWRKKARGREIRSEGTIALQPPHARMARPRPADGFADPVSGRFRCRDRAVGMPHL